MGFYPPNTLAAEARRRGVTIYPVDINFSEDKSCSDARGRMRLGLRLVTKLGEADRATILKAREKGAFCSLLDFCVRVVLKRDRLENLILAGAFDGIHPHRRGLLLRLDETVTLAAAHRSESDRNGQGALVFGPWRDHPTPCASDLQDFSPWDRLMWAYRITGVCADAHPLQFFREKLQERGIMTVLEALKQPAGTVVNIAGLNIRPHRPPTRSGRKVLFSTIEDESGFLQVVVLDEALEHCTATFLLAPAVEVQGRIEVHGKEGVSLRVEHACPLRVSKTSAYKKKTSETDGIAPTIPKVLLQNLTTCR
jgi:error-prone DNA polymerase